MTRIDRVFKQLKAKGEKALIPFITAGDPDLATTRALALEMAARGADMLELGVPFSDPLADGPTIQAASLRAMQGGVHLEDVLKLAGELTRPDPDSRDPHGLLQPHAAVRAGAHRHRGRGPGGGRLHHPGPAAGGGRPLAGGGGQGENRHHLPGRAHQRRRSASRHLGRLTKGFLYYVSVTGITGARTELPPDLAASLKEVRSLVKCPLAVGFGISTPEQVAGLAPYVDGVVVGSAIVQRVARLKGPELIKEVGDFIAALKAPLRAK